MNEDMPLRFRIPNDAVATRPFEKAFRYGVYFPGTDLVVSDMGGRGTGRPKNGEWIDTIQIKDVSQPEPAK